MPSFLYLSRAEIEPLVSMGDVIRDVEEAFGLFAKSRAGLNPASFSPMISFPTRIPHTDVDYRAGAMDPIPAVCTTLGFGYWDNPVKHGLPSVFALAVLSDLETGVPLAITEGYYLSAMRTGAAAAVASKYLARNSPHALAFIGAGSVARYMLWAHHELYKSIREVRAWSRSADKRERFASEMITKFGIPVQAVSDPSAALQGADIVCCCTPSREPIVKNQWIASGMHINAFGADAVGKQELDPEILRKAKIVVDSLSQCSVGGEIHKALAQGVIQERDVHAELGEIVNGWKQGRQLDQEITVMDSTGLSALDVVTFYRAYQKARSKRIGTELTL